MFRGHHRKVRILFGLADVLIVALAFQRGLHVFGFARRHARLITGIGGGLLVLVGVLEVTGAWSAAITWLQVHWSGYTAPI